MAFEQSDFEKLGVFYLGGRKAQDGEAPQPLLYDSRDLLTHAVCLGMTGSGKTGLCLALLEEAALDNIPAIIIDPKGDIANLLLTFPDLAPSDFRPWINEEDALRKGVSPDDYAQQQAEMWRKGLAAWGQDGQRIATLREKVDMAIYTPGSTSGLPVNVLSSFKAPVDLDEEGLAERVQTTVASLLGLLKIDADPVQSREGILLGTILAGEWRKGRDLDLTKLIEAIQTPPFEKVGVLNLETFYPAKDRFALVMALNNIIASPGFASWQQGESLDIGRTLYTAEGKPRLAIFSIAHLSDSERMFFVALLLNEFVSWTRAQSGTTSLRAMLYMDEVFGFLPPTANPPSKLPMLTLLKQARAFGVGLVLATQNPVDLDYKALSNAGTWFIGRLQTERDKARVLDGLQSASAGGTMKRADMEAVLAGLGQRVFLMNNVHDDAPVVFETRWVMSYLRGPLTRDQIRVLMAPHKTEARVVRDEPKAMPVQSEEPAAGKPVLPPDIPQLFFPARAGERFTPRLLGSARAAYRNAKLGLDFERDICLVARLPQGAEDVDWEAGQDIRPIEGKFTNASPVDASYEPLPAAASQGKNYAAWSKQFVAWVAANAGVEVYQCPALKLTAKPEETLAEFKARVDLRAREGRDAEMDKLRKKYADKQTVLQGRLLRAETAAQKQKEQASHARMQTLISVGSGILGAFLGRKALSSRNLSKAATAARGVGRSMKEGADVAVAEQSVEAVKAQMAALEEEFCSEQASLAVSAPEIETVTLKPLRTGVSLRKFSLAWLPKA